MLKLVFKEDFTPSHIKYKFFFTIALLLYLYVHFLTFAVIPFADVLVIDGKEAYYASNSKMILELCGF